MTVTMNIIDIIKDFRYASDVQNGNKNLYDLKMTFQFNSLEKIKYNKRNAKQRKLSPIKTLRAVVL